MRRSAAAIDVSRPVSSEGRVASARNSLRRPALNWKRRVNVIASAISNHMLPLASGGFNVGVGIKRLAVYEPV